MLHSFSIRMLPLLELMIIFTFVLIIGLLKAEVAKLGPLWQWGRVLRYASLTINPASGLSFAIYCFSLAVVLRKYLGINA